ncbi:MAG: hypothetical protein JKY86_08575 [Gammaproteobacteria bacterium]|nr:hypothetical protein [Gammaproteobacteria bacterium]
MSKGLIFLCLIGFSNYVFSQQVPTLQENENISLDEMDYVANDMSRSFRQMYEHILSDMPFAVGSIEDRVLIVEAVTTSPDSIIGIDYLDVGCEYFYATAPEDLNARRLADFFVDGSKAGVQVRYEFLKNTFNALSNSAKTNFENVTNGNAELRESLGSTDVLKDVDKSLQHFYNIGRVDLIARYTDFCNGGLSKLRKSLQDPSKIYGRGIDVEIGPKENKNDQ